MKTRELTVVGLFAALTAVLSIVRIPLPFTPVPVTLQVLTVTMAGAILGKKLGFLSQLTYVLLGAVGLPVFAGGAAGIGVLLGATGGYLWGFIVAAGVIGFLVEEGLEDDYSFLKKYIIIVSSMLVGLVIIYVMGALQLMLVTKLDLAGAFVQGVLPFILPGVVKIGCGSLVACFLRERLVEANLLPQGV